MTLKLGRPTKNASTCCRAKLHKRRARKLGYRIQVGHNRGPQTLAIIKSVFRAAEKSRVARFKLETAQSRICISTDTSTIV